MASPFQTVVLLSGGIGVKQRSADPGTADDKRFAHAEYIRTELLHHMVVDRKVRVRKFIQKDHHHG